MTLDNYNLKKAKRFANLRVLMTVLLSIVAFDALSFDYGTYVESELSSQYKQEALEKHIEHQLKTANSLNVDKVRLTNWYMLIGSEVSLFQNDFKNAWYWLNKIDEGAITERLLSRAACNKILLLISTSAFKQTYSGLVEKCKATKDMVKWEERYVLATQKLASVLLQQDREFITSLDKSVFFPNEYRHILTIILESLIDAESSNLASAMATAQQAYEKSQSFKEPTLYFAAAQNFSVILNLANNNSLALEITEEAIQKARSLNRMHDLVNALKTKANLLSPVGGIKIQEEAFYLAIQNQLVQGVFVHAKDLAAHYQITNNDESLRVLLDRTEHFVKLIAFYEDFKPQEVMFYDFIASLKQQNISHSIVSMQPDKLLTREERMRRIDFN